MPQPTLPRTPSNQPLLSFDTGTNELSPIETAAPRQPSVDNNKMLSAYEQQKQAMAARNRSSRTLPLRRSNKKSVTSAARQKLHQQQQKVDGAYCVLQETKFADVAAAAAASDSNRQSGLLMSTPQRQRTTTIGSVMTKPASLTAMQPTNSAAVDHDSDNDIHNDDHECSSESSSDFNSSSTEGSDSDSDKPAVQHNTDKVRHRSVVKSKPVVDTASQAAAKQAALLARHTYVMNRVGAIFGKQPGVENTTESHLHTRRFTLNDPYISKQHFQLRFVHDRFYLWDTASSNGTYLQRQHTSSIDQHNVWTYNQQPSPSVTLHHQTNHNTTQTTQSTMQLPAVAYFLADPIEQYAYLLQINRSIRIGTVELLVTGLIDDDTDNDCGSPYKCVLTYTLADSPANTLAVPNTDGSAVKSLVSPQSGKQYSITIHEAGASIGHCSDCTHVISDSSIADVHLLVQFINGKFYARNHASNTTHKHATWLRLSQRSQESLPIALYDGDHIRAGGSDFAVSLRSIPQTITPYTQPTACADAGVATNANFAVQKEMQDRYVLIDRYGGHDRCIFAAIFDGHQERTVADFAAAALHFNLLECIEQQMVKLNALTHSSKPSTPQQPAQPNKTPPLCVQPTASTLPVPVTKSPTDRRSTGTMQLLASQISPLHDETTDTTNGGVQAAKSPLRLSFRSTSLDATSMHHEHSVSRSSFMSTNSIDEQMNEANDDEMLYSNTDDALHIPQHQKGYSLYQQPSPQSISSPSGDHAGVRMPPFDMVQAMRDAYARTAQQIRGMGDASQYGGCTATTCVLWYYSETHTAVLYTANLGDSPAVLLRGNNSVIRLTKSHIARDPDEQQRVRDAGGKITANNRLAGMLEVTRSFGDLGMHVFGLIAEPTIASHIVLPTDTHLIVSSDGIFDVVTDNEVTTLVESKPLGIRSAHTVAQLLIDTAIKRKTRDNMSVVVVQLQPPAAPRPINRPNRAYTSEYGSDTFVSGDETDAYDLAASPPPTARGRDVVPSTEPAHKQPVKPQHQRPADETHVHIQRSFTEPDPNDLTQSTTSPNSAQSPHYVESEPDIDIHSPTGKTHAHYTTQHSTPGRLPYAATHKKAVDSFSMDDLTQAKHMLSNSPITTPIPKQMQEKQVLSRSQPSSPAIVDVTDELLTAALSNSKFSLGSDGMLAAPQPSSRSMLQNNTVAKPFIPTPVSQAVREESVDNADVDSD